MTIKFLLEKEFRQIFRHAFIPKLIVIYPLMVMVLLPWAATMDIKNISVILVDNDMSPLSAKFADKIDNSPYFKLAGTTHDYSTGINELEYGRADVVLEIPAGFEHDIFNLGSTAISLSINAVNSIKGGFGEAYMSALTAEFSQEIQRPANSEAYDGVIPKVDVTVLNMYNPYLDYKYTMIPGLMMIVIVLLCGFLPALNIVIEKEQGTIEQINVTPVGKMTFILAKMIPYWIIGYLSMGICVLLAWIIYGLVPAGSGWLIILFTTVFSLTMSGIGLIISNYSSTMQQAVFVIFFFIIIFIMMCGLLTPVASMPGWAQVFSGFMPTSYMVDAMRRIYLKGCSLIDLKLDFWVLAGMAFLTNAWAVLSYKKYN